jgi:hypothetical protein
MVVACIALFVALSGGAYAAGLVPINSVGSAQVINNSLRGVDIRESSLALPGRTSAVFQARTGPLPLQATFKSSGRPLVIMASGSGYTGSTGATIGMRVSIDNIPRADVTSFANEPNSHKTFVTNGIAITGLGSGSHTLKLAPLTGTSTDANDYFSATVFELPLALGLAPDRFEPNNLQSQRTGLCPASEDGLGTGTISPTSDVDWWWSVWSGSPETIDVTVTGGPRMDVYLWNTTTLLASNVKTFHRAHAGFEWYDFRVHSTTAAAYSINCHRAAGAARSVQRTP